MKPTRSARERYPHLHVMVDGGSDLHGQTTAVTLAEFETTRLQGLQPVCLVEWDDSGEHDYMSLGCSPTHLAVPLFLVSTTVLVNRKVFL